MAHVTAPDRTPPGAPPRLGVHVTDYGVEVAVLAPHAEAVDLCLLDPDPAAPGGWAERRASLRRRGREIRKWS